MEYLQTFDCLRSSTTPPRRTISLPTPATRIPIRLVRMEPVARRMQSRHAVAALSRPGP